MVGMIIGEVATRPSLPAYLPTYLPTYLDGDDFDIPSKMFGIEARDGKAYTHARHGLG